MAGKYLVTGGAGFIGSHLCDALIAAGHQVTSLDNLSTGDPANVAHLVNHPGFRAVTGSVLDRELLATTAEGIDAVFHLAAAVGNELILQRRVAAIETNVVGTSTVLELCSERRLPVLITSSSEVYGKSAAVPFREDDDLAFGSTTIARWSYGCGKALDEFLALAHASESGLPVTVARLFNTTGPRQIGNYGMVLPRFVRQAVNRESITVYGDGEQSRCFCDVEDVVGALVALMDCEAARGSVVNIGSDEEVRIADLATRIMDFTGSSAPIRYIHDHPTADSEVRRRVPDLTRARQLIGFRSRHALDDIIHRVVEFERARTGVGGRGSGIEGRESGVGSRESGVGSG
jgi:UDP-glucose 4-epimerase